MSTRFLHDNGADRELGAAWEQNFGRLAAWYGKSFHAYQRDRVRASGWHAGGRRGLTPDYQILNAGGEYHELKHKNATKRQQGGERCYGLERYRLKHLLHFHNESEQAVFYTIHDWEAAGAHASSDAMPNLLQDWRIAPVETLVAYAVKREPEWLRTWIDGKAATCHGYYWPISMWDRLDLYWGLPR